MKGECNMTMYIGHASIDEYGKIAGGAAGDQTAKEVCKRTYYMHSKGWYLLRPKSIAHANAIAQAMLRACNNNNIGYDQNNRLGIVKYGTASTVKTECDCSSLVRQCVKEATGKDAGNFTTANEKSKLEATGLFEAAIAVTSSTVLYNGDVLVTKTKGHTVIVVEGNPRKESVAKKSDNVRDFQNAAVLDGFTFPKYGADGDWGAECESVASKAVVKCRYEYVTVNGKRTKKAVYKYRNLTKIVQRKVGVKVDGKCGEKTKAAIVAFQHKHGLKEDGCCGLNTWRKILGV
jgi:peptidoglycan hydrolase-like protein with peptidoglycan-binding domain